MNKKNCSEQIPFVFVVLHPGYQALISLQSPLLLLPAAITLSESAHSNSSDEPLFSASNLLVVVSISSDLVLHYNFVQHTEQNFGSGSGKKNLFKLLSSDWASIGMLSKSSCRTITLLLSGFWWNAKPVLGPPRPLALPRASSSCHSRVLLSMGGGKPVWCCVLSLKCSRLSLLGC